MSRTRSSHPLIEARRRAGLLAAWLLTALIVLAAAALGPQAAAAGAEAVSDPLGAAPAAVWSRGLSELGGAIAAGDAVAGGLLAGEAADFEAEVVLQVGGPYSGATGVVFGFRDAGTLWLAGYNPQEGRFEILRQAGGAPEVLAEAPVELAADGRLAFTLRVAGAQVTLARDGRAVLSLDTGTPLRGVAGLGAVHVRGGEVVIESLKMRRPDGSALADLRAQGADGWRAFSAAELVEGSAEWAFVDRFQPPADAPEDGLRADLLLDADPAGVRFRREVALRTGAAFSGRGMAGLAFGYRDAAHYNLLVLDPENRRVDLWHRSADGFEPLASARFDMEEDWLAFAVEGEGDRVQVSAGGRTLFDLRDPRFVGARTGLATHGSGRRPALWRAGALRVGGEPLPPKAPDDLLAHALGARALYLEPEGLADWERLIDHPIGGGPGEEGEVFALDGATAPVAAVFSFPYQRLARIEQLEVVLGSTDGPGESGPVRFLASMDTPLSGFVELAVLDPRPGERTSVVLDPVTAKYLRVEFPEAAGRSLQVTEIRAQGSLLGRALARAPAPDAAAAQASAADLVEQEPNDRIEEAMRLPPAVWVGGEVGAGDVDHYRLNLPAEGGEVVLTGRNPGALPAHHVLVDGVGQPQQAVSLEQGADGWQARYRLGGGAWFVRMASDPLWLTVLFDDSGSMGAARDALPKLLLQLADRVGPGLRVKLMKYAETPVEIFDFVDDPAALRAAVERDIEASGGTETLAGLMGGLESLREVRGNRALLVALDGVDGYADPEPYQAFWRALVVSAPLPVHVVGVGTEDWDSEDRTYGLSDRNFFSEVAWASRGQFVIKPALEAFKREVGGLLARLSAAVPYRLRAEFIEAPAAIEARGQGALRLEIAPEATRERVRTVELVLDASNSMWGRIDGRPKIEIAREVLKRLIGELPAGVHLGLRVYGHRWPRTDARACTDSELVFPVGPLDRAALIRHVQGVTPKGRTPLVHSLLQAPKDFGSLARGTVILVSDGIESCDGQIEDVVKALQAAGIDLTVHVVGFDVRERSAREELERAARALGGRYFDAADAGQLGAALERTLRIEYELRAPDGTVRARGLVGGDAVALEAGEYRLRVLIEPEPIERVVKVAAGSEQVLEVSGGPGRWAVGAP